MIGYNRADVAYRRGCGYKLVLFFLLIWFEWRKKNKKYHVEKKLIFIEIACRHFLHRNSHRGSEFLSPNNHYCLGSTKHPTDTHLYKSQPLPTLYVGLCPSCLHAENSQILTSAAVCVCVCVCVWVCVSLLFSPNPHRIDPPPPCSRGTASRRRRRRGRAHTRRARAGAPGPP